MIKKVAFGTMAVAAIGGMVLGKDVFSYARTGYTTARDRIRSEVPVEFEIERARQEVDQLIPEVRKAMHLIAEEQVEVAHLQESIAKRESKLEAQEEAILAMSADLKTGDSQFVYAGHRYTQGEVEKDLAERFNRFKIAEDTLKEEKSVLAAKQQALQASRSTLEEMLTQKKTLEAQIERMEARLQTINARKQINGLEVDDSQLTRVKTLITSIEKRLDVEDAVLASEGDLNGLIPVEVDQEESVEDIASEIDNYFGSRREVEQASF
ncbi:MAG: hypothetical protein KDA80_09955 [Planctomycetaceae bacterium]|nr:hypothetical protein [Planctomycetaceae bacterium]